MIIKVVIETDAGKEIDLTQHNLATQLMALSDLELEISTTYLRYALKIIDRYQASKVQEDLIPFGINMRNPEPQSGDQYS